MPSGYHVSLPNPRNNTQTFQNSISESRPGFHSLPLPSLAGEHIDMAAAAEGVRLNHIARESPDVKRLAAFYQDVLGFERLETPKFGEFEVVWLSLPPSFSLHLIERNPESKLPEGPHSAAPGAVADPRDLPRGHHVSFAVSNYDSFVKSLKERGIETIEKTQPDGKTRQVFFFDPDGNGLEVGSWASP